VAACTLGIDVHIFAAASVLSVGPAARESMLATSAYVQESLSLAVGVEATADRGAVVVAADTFGAG